MSGIFDQVINYAPFSLLKGTVTYKGTWSAATNTPTLINPPDSTTNGHYYVVSAAGTQFSLSFNIGDWIISNGSAWEKVDNTDAVSSVFGRTGAVVGVSTDYSAVGITNTALGASNPSTVAATTVTATSTIAATGAVTGSNLSGTNTGDQTITLTGGVTGSGTGSFAATVVTNANLTGVITSVGNATSIASQTGTGTKFVVDTSPVLVTPNIGIATGTSLAAALNGSLGATTPSTIAATTISASGNVTLNNTQLLQFKDSTGSANSFIHATALDVLRIQHSTANKNIFVTVNGGSGVIQFGEQSGTVYGSFSSTGLAVTGKLSSTAASNIFTFVNSTAGSATNKITFGVTTNEYSFINYSDTTGYLSIGQPSGRSYGVNIQTNGANVGVFTATGLAVTGALSATGAITNTADDFIRSGAAGGVRGYWVKTSGTNRWFIYANGTAESGSNAGSNFAIAAYNDAGSGLGDYFSINRATGAAAFAAGLAVTGLISATTTVKATTEFHAVSPTNTGSASFRSAFTTCGVDLANSLDTSGVAFINFRKADSTAIGSINRVALTNAVVYNTSSDARLKENFRDFTDSGRLIDALKPRVFDWKGDTNGDGKNVIGFVAQEEHAADPIFAHIGAVSVGDDDPTTITKQWQRSDAALIPILVAELQSLRKRLAALESQ